MSSNGCGRYLDALLGMLIGGVYLIVRYNIVIVLSIDLVSCVFYPWLYFVGRISACFCMMILPFLSYFICLFSDFLNFAVQLRVNVPCLLVGSVPFQPIFV